MKRILHKTNPCARTLNFNLRVAFRRGVKNCICISLLTLCAAGIFAAEPEVNTQSAPPVVVESKMNPTSENTLALESTYSQFSSEAESPKLESSNLDTSTSNKMSGVPDRESEMVKKVSFRFTRASLEQVLRYISNITGCTVVKDAEVSGDITILSEKDISVEDALSALNSALAVKGYTSIRVNNVLKIVPIDAAKQAEVKVRVGSDPNTIEPSDEFITQVIPLSYADAAELKRDLANLMPKRGDLSANARSNTLIVTDIASNVRRFAEIIKQLDAPQTSVTQIRVFPLVNADAQALATILNDLFKSDTLTTTTGTGALGGGPGQFFRQFMGGPPGAPGTSAGQTGTAGASQPTAAEAAMARARVTVKIAVDTRTNSLVVSAPAADMAVIEGLIAKLDQDETEPEGTLVIHLQHGDAATLATMLTNLLQASGTQAQTSGTGGTNLRNITTTRVTQTAAVAKGDTLLGQVRIAADKDTNSLIFITSPRNFARLRELVSSLDFARPQVLIEVLIAEKTLNDQTQLGAEWTIFPSGEILGEWVSSVASTSFNLGSITQGLTYSITNKNIQGIIKALKKDSKLNILSTPRILTSDNAAATIKVGEQVPFLTSRQVTDTGSIYYSYQYRDVGITLTVTPHINPDGFVTMTIHPIISKIEETTYFDAPVIANREASTEVMVKTGETVIIGGLMKDDWTETVHKIPILGSLPILGHLFKSTNNIKEKTELLVFLTPHVVRTADELNSLSAKDISKLNSEKMKNIK
ncbi:MAG: type II secretion system secretin GspD [bacterium]|nr:type II secretion system secretin GspD [bacterium]